MGFVEHILLAENVLKHPNMCKTMEKIERNIMHTISLQQSGIVIIKNYKLN